MYHVGSLLNHAGYLDWGHRRSSCSAVGSVVVSFRLSCSTACGILAPRPEIKPTSPALEGRFFTSGPPGKSHTSLFIDLCWSNLALILPIVGGLLTQCHFGYSTPMRQDQKLNVSI